MWLCVAWSGSLHTSEGWSQVWGNGGMTNTGGKPKKLGKNTAPDPHRHEPHTNSLGIEPAVVWCIMKGCAVRCHCVTAWTTTQKLINNYQQIGIRTWRWATFSLLLQTQIIMRRWWCQRVVMDTWWRTVAGLHSSGHNTWHLSKQKTWSCPAENI